MAARHRRFVCKVLQTKLKVYDLQIARKVLWIWWTGEKVRARSTIDDKCVPEFNVSRKTKTNPVRTSAQFSINWTEEYSVEPNLIVADVGIQSERPIDKCGVKRCLTSTVTITNIDDARIQVCQKCMVESEAIIELNRTVHLDKVKLGVRRAFEKIRKEALVENAVAKSRGETP